MLIFEDRSGKSPYLEWLNELDWKTQERILSRTSRLKNGQFGDCKSVGEGLYELRLFFGSGYRIYFKQYKGQVILILCGGDKSTQNKDIKLARKFWKTYMEDNL